MSLESEAAAHSMQAYTVRGFSEVRNMNVPDHILLADLPELSDEEKHQRTLAGLADVDTDRMISHEEMLEWARSLFDRPAGLR